MSVVRAKNYGRRGNSLFQNCCAIGYALKHRIQFSVPTTTTNNFWSPLYDQHLVNPNWIEGKEDVIIKEYGMPYQELPFEEDWRGKQIVLDGYWQTEKYFKEYRKEILDLLGYKWNPNGLVSVHQRRTDFLELENKHPKVTDEWYNEAMSLFPNKKFLFFSDDIEYSKSVWGWRSDCFFSQGRSIEDDLITMSNCDFGNICSASTYAWWGMFLNRNKEKKVIFPQLWFVENWCNEDSKDILPDWVIKL